MACFSRVAGKLELLEKYLVLDFVISWTCGDEKGDIEVFALRELLEVIVNKFPTS